MCTHIAACTYNSLYVYIYMYVCVYTPIYFLEHVSKIYYITVFLYVVKGVYCAEMGKNTSKCILIQNTKYPSNKCINTKYKILVPENVTKCNTCILYLKYRKYLFWIFHFLTIWYSRAFRFGLYNVHKAFL